MNSGIYAYYDNLKCKIIYVGKDSNIDKKRRYYAHYSKSRKNEQQINKVLQNDNKSGRYSYVVLEKGIFTTEELNKKEMSWISFFNPIFNFTSGGDGAGYGKNNPMYGRIGENNPQYKPEARIIKNGISKNKQVYGLIFKTKVICRNYNRDFLEELAQNLNQNKITIEEAKNKNLKNSIKNRIKYEARVIKKGKNKNNKQNYALKIFDKYICESIDEDFLKNLAQKYNKKKITIEKIKEEVKKNKSKKLSQRNNSYITIKNYGKGWEAQPTIENGKRKTIYSSKLQKCIEKVEDFINSNENKYGYTSYKVIK